MDLHPYDIEHHDTMMFTHQPLFIKFILWYQSYIMSNFFKTTTIEVLELDLQNLEPTMILI